MQKPSLYHHIASKEDLLWEVAWEGAEAFHAGARLGSGGRARARADPPRAAGAPRRRLRRSSTSRPSSSGSGATSKASAASGSSPSAAATRSGSAISSATASSAASCAPTSTSRPLRCSFSRPRTGRTRGCGRAPAPTSSPTGSSRPARRHARLRDAGLAEREPRTGRPAAARLGLLDQHDLVCARRDRQCDVELERRLADSQMRDHVVVEGSLVGRRLGPALPDGGSEVREAERRRRDGATRRRSRTARPGRA